MRQLKVFIVDDDKDFAEGVAITMEMAGHVVEIAHSGEEAIQKFHDSDYDITFMDVRMPGLNGVESFFEIRKIKPNANVVMMTAYSVRELLAQAIEGGALGVLHKPVGSKEFIKALDAVKPSGIILVADDDPEFADGICNVLKDAGHNVITAHTCREAVQRAMSDAVDVLILDLRLPILSGLEVYVELKRQGRTVPTVIVTGFDIEEFDTIDELRSLSIKGYLTKPVRSDDLLHAVDSLMQGTAWAR